MARAYVFARAAARGLALARAQVLALLCHDAVYVAGAQAGRNEALSALLLRQAAHELSDLPGDEVERACAMIRDTVGYRPGSADSEVVIALDLATPAFAANVERLARCTPH
jgi:predicted metal-dependent HD superfamily phosphohydrolase